MNVESTFIVYIHHYKVYIVDLVVVLERRLWITRVSGAKKKKCEYIFREITISMQNHIFCTHTDYTLHYGLFGN